MRIVTFCALAILFSLYYYVNALPGCDINPLGKCFLENNLGSMAESKFPSLNSIGATAYGNTEGKFGMKFELEHCNACQWVVSFIPMSAVTNPKLQLSDQSDYVLTSLNKDKLPGVSNLWGGLFKTEENFCVYENNMASIANVQLPYSGSLFETSLANKCAQEINLKAMTYSEMKNLKDSSGANVFQESVQGNELVLQTTLYVHLFAPFDEFDASLSYKTIRYAFKIKIKYELTGSMTMSSEVVRQRELLVSINENEELEVVTKMFLDDKNVWDGDCYVASDSDIAASIVEQVDPDAKIRSLTFLSSTKNSANGNSYEGDIKFKCDVQTCDNTGCEKNTATFAISINTGVPSEISQTTKFDVTGEIYVGTSSNAFDTLLNKKPITSADERIGIKVKTSNLPSEFTAAFEDLEICPTSCATAPSSNKVVLFSGGIAPASASANYLSGVVHTAAQMGSFGHNGALGFSFDLRSVLAMKASVWEFKATLKFSTTSSKRSIGDMERDEQAQQFETATITKRIDLFPSAMSGATSSSTSGAGDKLVAILIPSIAGGICLMCMFGIVALVGLVLLGSILRKGVHGKGGHHRMEEDASIPSDSDVDLRNHAV